MTEIIEISIDLANKKISLVYPDSTSDIVDLPDQGFLKIVGSAPFRDVLLWKPDEKVPELKRITKKPRRKNAKKSKLSSTE